MEKLNEKWAQDRSDAKISAGQAGTGAGFQKFIAGDIDFADASRPIKDEEKQNYRIRISNTKNSKLRKMV